MTDTNGRAEPLIYTDVTGRRVTISDPRFDGHDEGSPVDIRLLHADRWLMCKRVVHPNTPTGRRALELLDNEIRTAMRLQRVYGPDYPPELGRLVGYDMDGDRPYLLMEADPGQRWIQEFVGLLSLENQDLFLIDVVRGLSALHRAGLVHRAVGPAAVVWNGEHARLVDFGHAMPKGTARTALGAEPWHPREQVLGRGVNDPSDDVWSAGVLTVYVATACLPVAKSTGGELTGFGGGVRRALQGVFAADPAIRPSIRDILLRLDKALPPLTGYIGPDPGFAAGFRAFDKVRKAKNPDAPQEPEAEVAPPPSPPPPDEPEPESVIDEPAGERPLRLLGIAVFVLVVFVVSIFVYFGMVLR